jgi:hypothetical protein
VSGYFSAQADSLSKSAAVWRKAVRSAGEKEEILETSADKLNWKKEFSLFFEADLRKKAYAGKFTVDSAFTTGKRTLRYTSEKTKIKSVTLHFLEGSAWPDLEALIQTGNLFYRSEYRLEAKPYLRYRVQGRQEVFFPASEKTFTVEWELKPWISFKLTNKIVKGFD